MKVNTPEHQRTQASFNPHSPLLANEAELRAEAELGRVVSIHIRHCWRMNLPL